MKKLLSLLLTVGMLLSVLSACGSQPESSTAPVSSAAPTESPVETAVSAPQDVSTVESSMEAPLEAPSLTPELPLVDTPTTLSLWWGGWNGNEFGCDSPNDVMVSQEAEKRTGIHVDYVYCSRDASTEQGALMYASGDYCDIIAGGQVEYTGGFEKGVEDGIYLNLNDLIDEHAPNYASIRNADEKVYKDTMTDDGNVIAIWEVTNTIQWPWFGLLCRADFLDEVGKDVPVTYDDMHDVLLAFKNELGLTNAYQLGASGYNDMAYLMMAGYDVTPGWYQIDGQVQYGPVSDGFKSYLEMMNTWYSEGLVSQDFVTANMFDNSDILNGQTGVFGGNYTDCTNYSTLLEDPDAHVIGIPEPVVNEGDTVHIGQYNTRAANKWVCISTACADPELALHWVDYFYSEEGALLNSYGVEGETFEFGADGKPMLSELITNNPDGYSFNQSMYRYLDGGPSVRLYDWERELGAVNEDSLACQQAWSHDGAHLFPTKATPTAEESEDLTGIMSDIETYVNTTILQFIRGDKPLSEWDSYVDYIWDSDLQSAIDIKQEILDRYNSR